MSELAYEQRERQEAIEYGVYRAKYPIQHDGVIAYMPGHAVPVSNVRLHGYDEMGLVERVDGQPLDAPLPDGYTPVEPAPDGEGWNSPDGNEPPAKGAKSKS